MDNKSVERDDELIKALLQMSDESISNGICSIIDHVEYSEELISALLYLRTLLVSRSSLIPSDINEHNKTLHALASISAYTDYLDSENELIQLIDKSKSGDVNPGVFIEALSIFTMYITTCNDLACRSSNNDYETSVSFGSCKLTTMKVADNVRLSISKNK